MSSPEVISKSYLLYTLPGLFIMVLAHLFASFFTHIHILPGSFVISLFGGISSAYVFIDLLPTIFEYQTIVYNEHDLFLREQILFLCVFAGFVVFYVLEVLARKSRRNVDEKIESKTKQKRHRHHLQCNAKCLRQVFCGKEKEVIQFEETPPIVFWIHIIPFTAKNFLIGFIFVQQVAEHGLLEAYLYCFATTVHVFVVDFSLYTHHRKLYQYFGRFALVSALGMGYIISVFFPPTWLLILYILESILAGAMILNIIKEELPEERESNVFAFLIGATTYTILLFFI